MLDNVRHDMLEALGFVGETQTHSTLFLEETKTHSPFCDPLGLQANTRSEQMRRALAV